MSDELARLNTAGFRVVLTLPADRITVRGQPMELTDDQELRLEQAKGRAIRFVLERVVASPAYQRLGDDAKARALEAQIARARRHASTQQRRLVLSELRQQGPVAAR